VTSGCTDRGRRAVRSWSDKWMYRQRKESSEEWSDMWVSPQVNHINVN